MRREKLLDEINVNLADLVRKEVRRVCGEVRCTEDRLLQFTFLTRRIRPVLIYAVIICRSDS